MHTYLAPALGDGAEDVHHLLEHLPLAGEFSVHVVVEEDLHQAVGRLEPPKKLLQHRSAPERGHLQKFFGGIRGVMDGEGGVTCRQG